MVRYLEGFHAADLALLGSRSLAENESAGDEDGEGMQRVREGYGALARRMADRLDPALVEIRLRSAVRSIRWRPGEVRVELAGGDGDPPATAVAPRAIVTLPLVLLQRALGEPGAVGIEPWPDGWRERFGQLHMGAAHRVTLVFDGRFWARDGEDGPTFVHGTDQPFPVWWTALPSHAPVLTGWIGGPRAEALTGREPDEVLRHAIESLASIFGRDAAMVPGAPSAIPLSTIGGPIRTPVGPTATAAWGPSRLARRWPRRSQAPSSWPARPWPRRDGTPPSTARSPRAGWPRRCSWRAPPRTT